MTRVEDEFVNRPRREFLRFLAASPALMAAGPGMTQGFPDLYAPERVSRAADAVNVFDLHEVAKARMRPAHYTYMATGSDGGGTLRANREGFRQFKLRVRRLVDTSSLDTSFELFGRDYPVPIMIAPCGSQKGFHPEGELATRRAAVSRNVEMMLSTVSSTSIEDVNAIGDRPAWFQLYASPDVKDSLVRAKRAEAAGSPVLAVTVDNPASNRDTVRRQQRGENPECQVCHGDGPGSLPPKPMVQGVSLRRYNLDWDYVDRLRDGISMKLVLKGIVTAEDAALAVEHGADGIVVSNHGGRTEDSGRSTIESLGEVVDAVDGRIPVICDSGFRRGTDIFKALALGADAIAIGRPYLWGLAAFGQEGVETVIDLLTRELEIVMRQAGVTSLNQVDRRYLA